MNETSLKLLILMRYFEFYYNIAIWILMVFGTKQIAPTLMVLEADDYGRKRGGLVLAFMSLAIVIVFFHIAYNNICYNCRYHCYKTRRQHCELCWNGYNLIFCIKRWTCARDTCRDKPSKFFAAKWLPIWIIMGIGTAMHYMWTTEVIAEDYKHMPVGFNFGILSLLFVA